MQRNCQGLKTETWGPWTLRKSEEKEGHNKGYKKQFKRKK